uniref:C-type lectin domain-containing protein n=1 Tax=Sander lucioperca TaxID=283035 RepID=A0A8C9Z9Q7_SANLU
VKFPSLLLFASLFSLFGRCGWMEVVYVTFVSINTPMTWTHAQIYCRAHHTDLASVRNSTENQKIQVMLPGVYYIWGWIGLFRDSWKWSDGSNSSFSFWKNGQPDNNNETCVAADFSQSGAWEDWPCDMERAFISFSFSNMKILCFI